MGEGIVLGRVGHYHNPGARSCQTALVVLADPLDASHLDAPDGTVNLAVWQHDGEQFRREDVPVKAPNESLGEQGDVATFHLTRDCPWGR